MPLYQGAINGSRAKFLYALALLLMAGALVLRAAPGDTKWVFPTGAAINSAPAIGPGGTVYFGSGDHKVYAVDGRTGDKLWDFPTEGAVDADPAIGLDGTVYISSRDAKVYALNGFTGLKKWEFVLPNIGDFSTPASLALGPEGTIYAGGSDGKLYAIDGAEGRQKWAVVTGANLINVAPVIGLSPAIGADGTIYVAITAWEDRSIAALDSVTGSNIWTYDMSYIPTSRQAVSPAIGARGTIYVSTDASLVALDAATGKERWKTPGDYENMITCSPAMGSDGTLYFGSGYGLFGRIDGYVHAVDPATGKL